MKFSTKNKFLFFLFTLLFANVSLVLAQVNISSPINGRNISNELSSVGSSPAYIALNDITISEKDPGDFTAGTNVTLTFDTPTGWRFNPGVGSASGTGTNISAVSVTGVTASRITVRYTIAAGVTDGSNSIKISGIQVQSTSAAVGTEAFIFRQGGTGTVNGLTAGVQGIGSPIAPLSKVAGNYQALQLLLPGQTNAPGTATGQSGVAVITPIAGADIAVTVNAVDFGFNVVTAESNLVSLTSNNPYATIPAAAALVSGTKTFNVKMNAYSPTAGTFYTVTAKDEVDGGIALETSTNIRVLADSFNKLLTLFPGETLDPGSATGKTGSAASPQAGVNYPLTVYSVDQFWNRVTGFNHNISMSATGVTNFTAPTPANLGGGARAFNLLFKVADETPTLLATNNTDGTKTAYSQLLPAVTLGAFTKLQVLLPGETAAPGTVAGKTGPVTPQSPGIAFNVIVNAVDANWNIIPSVTSNVNLTNVNAAYNDPLSDIEVAKDFVSGTATFNVKQYFAATNHQLRATDAGAITATSAVYTVSPGSFSKLLIVLPGETYQPGTVDGKIGSISSITANANLTVNVRAVDTFSNTVPSVTDVVNLTTTNVGGIFTSNGLALAAGTRNFTARLPTAGTTSTITVKNADLTHTYTTDEIEVENGAFTKLVLMLPGERDSVGIAAGKTGTPIAQVAGIPFVVKVKATDAFGNTITSVSDVVHFAAISDIYAEVPADMNLVNGILETTATYRIGNASNNRRLTASNLTDGTKTASQSPTFTVNVGAYAGLLVIVPGETYAAGHPDGKVNGPSAQVPNANFNITVRAVDVANNTVTSITDQVTITSSDGGATLPAMASLVAGVKTNFTVALENNGTFTASSITEPGKVSPASTTVIVSPGSFVKLQILFPGETADPGTPTGKSGTPNAQAVGVPFNVTVNAVDAVWNVITSVTDEVAITNVNGAYDATSSLPANKNLVAGTNTFSVTLNQAATNHQLRASDITSPAKTVSTSPLFTVSPGAFAKLLITMPGETYTAGTVLGKTGSITPVTVNANVTVTVRAVDALSNIITSVTDVVKLTSTDVNAVFTTNSLPLTAGLRNFTTRLTTASNTTTITATDTTNISKSPYTTAAIAVNAAAFSKFVVVLPGETEVQGTIAGKTGTPLPQVAGEPFNVWIKATDAYGNTITTINDVVTFTATNDSHAQLPADVALVNGVLATTATYRIGNATNNRRINVAKVGDGTKTGASTVFTVNVGAYDRLLIVLPGETYTAGHANGKVNTASSQIANVPFNITVRAVDKAFNMITTVADEVKITSNVSATLPANASLVNGVKANFSVALSTTGKLTAESITTPAATAYTTSDINITIGSFVKLQVLLPGEIAAPGTASGKTGTPSARTAGVGFNVTVNAVDANWNVITSVTDVVGITNVNATYNSASTIEVDKALVAGTGVFSITQNTAATNHQLTATDNTASFAANSAVFTVSPSAFTKLLIILPGETYVPGTVPGKTGSITPVAADANLTVTVRAVDAFSNTVTSNTSVVNLTTTDVNGVFTSNNLALVAGTRNFVARLRTAGNTTTITVKDVPETSTYTTDAITVTGGLFTKLILIMPGETSVEGLAAGKTGAPTTRTAGVPFTISVRASDAFGNTVTSVNDVVRFSAENDIYAILPSNTALVNGMLTTSATYRIAGANRRLTATDFTDGTKTASISSRFSVNVGSYAKLLVVLPGETFTPGSPAGKLNPPANQATDVAFNVEVRAVDAAFNQIAGITDIITLTSTDVLATMPGSAALVNGLKSNFSVKLKVSATITATNTSDGTKLPYTTGTVLVVGATATNHHFRSTVALGNWNNSSTWESSPNGTTLWQPSTISPTNASTAISVRAGNTVNITANLTADDVLIENGGQVNVTGGTLTIAIGGFNVQGILRLDNNRTITTTGVLKIDATGKYQHNYTTLSGTIPTATWTSGSVCEVIGYTNFIGDVLGSNQNFSDFVWNAPNQTAVGSPALLGSFNSRNFTVTSTGLGELNLATTGGSSTITGNYTQTVGKVVLNKTSGTQNLSFGGNFAVNGGSFALGNGTVNLTFNGSSAQSLANAGPAIDFQSVLFTNGGTKTLTSGNFNLVPTGVLTMGASTNLNANGKLNLRSIKTSTATIAAIPSGSSITGNVRVERFISGGPVAKFRTFRMLSSPTHNGSNRYSFTEFIDDMYVTGKGGASNDFDESAGNAASAFTYNAGFKNVNRIDTTIAVGTGAYMFFRGDRSGTAGRIFPTFVDPEDVTMDFNGVLNQQSVTATLVNNVNLVGNPYASSIDWNSGITKTGLKNNILRIWNPASRSYATYDGLISVPIDVASNIIPSGQGFFVEAAVAGASLTFSEGAKVNTQPSTLLLAAPINERLTLNNETVAWSNNDNQVLSAPHTEVRLTLAANASSLKEETVVVFKAGKSSAFEVAEDASYFSGGSEQMVFLSSRSTDNRDLVINYMPEVSPTSQVKFNINALNKAGDYQLMVNYKDIPTGYTLKLNDKFLATSIMVQNGDIHAFTIDKSKSGTFGADRFSISFDAPTTLPVTLTSFAAIKVNKGVAVSWSAETELNHNRYELERAGEDQSYKKLVTVTAKGSGFSYSFLDKTPLLGNNYYRLVEISNDNKSTATAPIVINYNGGVDSELIAIFPNPVKEQFTVKFNGSLKGAQQTVKITSITGQVLLTKSIATSELTTGYALNIGNYAAGLYMVEIFENGNQKVGQTKLIKQ